MPAADVGQHEDADRDDHEFQEEAAAYLGVEHRHAGEHRVQAEVGELDVQQELGLLAQDPPSHEQGDMGQVDGENKDVDEQIGEVGADGVARRDDAVAHQARDAHQAHHGRRGDAGGQVVPGERPLELGGREEFPVLSRQLQQIDQADEDIG